MTKFEIMTDSFEFRFGTAKRSIPAMSAAEVFDAYHGFDFGNAHEPQREASFDAEADARETFAREFSGYGRTYAEKAGVFWTLTGRLAWIEVNEYDDDGEFDQGGEVADWSAEGYDNEEEK